MMENSTIDKKESGNKALILLLVCLAGLQFVLVPLEYRVLDTNVEKLGILCLLSLTTLVLTWQKQLKIPQSWMTLLIGGLSFLSLLSGLWAAHLSLIWPSVVTWCIYLLLFVVFYSLPSSVLRSRVLSIGVILIVSINNLQIVYLCLEALIESSWSITLQEIEALPRIYRLNTNFVGSNLLLYIPILLVIRKSSKLQWLIHLNLLIILILIPLLSSKAVTIALVILIIYYLTKSRGTAHSSHYLRGGFVALSVILFIFQFFIKGKVDYFKSYNITRSFQKDSGDDRLDIWSNTLELIREKPLIGHGAGNWKTEVFKFGSHDYSLGFRYTHAHNLWLEWTSELGVIGLLMFIGILILGFARASESSDSHLTAFLIGLLTLCSFYGIYVASSSGFPPYLIILFIWLGIVGRETKSYQFPFVATVTSIVLFGLLGLSIFIHYHHLSFNRYLSSVKNAEGSEKLELLSQWNNYSHPYFNQFRVGRSLSVIRSNQLWNSKMKKRSIEVLTQSLQMDPYDWKAWQALGLRHARIRDNGAAAASFKQVLNLYPDVRSALTITRIGLNLRDEELYRLGLKFYEEELESSFLQVYSDDFLVDPNGRISSFWIGRCKAIDQYQEIMELWDLRVE